MEPGDLFRPRLPDSRRNTQMQISSKKGAILSKVFKRPYQHTFLATNFSL